MKPLDEPTSDVRERGWWQAEERFANLETIALTKEAIERIIEAGRQALKVPIQYFPPPLAALSATDPWSPAGRAAAMRARLQRAGISTAFDMIWRSR